MSLIIRQATLLDAGILSELSRKTFTESFYQLNNPEDFEQYIETAFSYNQIRRELGDTNSKFYLAQMGARVVGYLKLRFKTPKELEYCNALEIQRIYVLKTYQGLGIGKALMNKALAVAKQASQDCLWLGVWEYNPKSIRFYESLGFEKFGEHTFMIGNDRQTDWMMSKAIV